MCVCFSVRGLCGGWTFVFVRCVRCVLAAGVCVLSQGMTKVTRGCVCVCVCACACVYVCVVVVVG